MRIISREKTKQALSSCLVVTALTLFATDSSYSSIANSVGKSVSTAAQQGVKVFGQGAAAGTFSALTGMPLNTYNGVGGVYGGGMYGGGMMMQPQMMGGGMYGGGMMQPPMMGGGGCLCAGGGMNPMGGGMQHPGMMNPMMMQQGGMNNPMMMQQQNMMPPPPPMMGGGMMGGGFGF